MKRGHSKYLQRTITIDTHTLHNRSVGSLTCYIGALPQVDGMSANHEGLVTSHPAHGRALELKPQHQQHHNLWTLH